VKLQTGGADQGFNICNLKYYDFMTPTHQLSAQRHKRVQMAGPGKAEDAKTTHSQFSRVQLLLKN
jgi:hypothetical protein